MAKFDPVRCWIKSVGHSHSDSEGTENNYNYYISMFFEYVGRSAEEILGEYENSTDREFKRKYARYVKTLIANKMDTGYSPNTIANLVTTIQSFFKYNDLPLGFIPRGRRRVVYHNRDLAKEELIKILGASRPRERAFFTMMAQTGLRPTTLCKLKIKHILPDFRDGTIPCKTDVPQELAKGKYRNYFSFMGEESVKALKKYFLTRRNLNRESFLFVSHGRNPTEVSPKTFSAVFSRTARKLKQTGEIDFEAEYGKPAKLRLYNLRKYFRKYAGQAGADFVNFWMGHTLGVDEHYFSRDPELHRKMYMEKAMPHLRLETATPSETERELVDLRKEQEELRDERDFLHKRIGMLEARNDGLANAVYPLKNDASKAIEVAGKLQHQVDILTKKVEELSKQTC